MNDKPAPLLEKYQVLDRLREFMKGSLAPAGVDGKFRGQAYARYPYLDAWLQTQHAILFMLTDGTVQLNFEYVSQSDSYTFLSNLSLGRQQAHILADPGVCHLRGLFYSHVPYLSTGSLDQKWVFA